MRFIERFFPPKTQEPKLKKQESTDTSTETAPLNVGDMVQHPLRSESVPIQYIGSEIYCFIPKAYLDDFDKRGKRTGTYEAIEGSPSYTELEKDSRFVKRKIRTEASAEIDFTNDVEQRTLVVPLSTLKPVGKQ
jgi:hypothetical protein